MQQVIKMEVEEIIKWRDPELFLKVYSPWYYEEGEEARHEIWLPSGRAWNSLADALHRRGWEALIFYEVEVNIFGGNFNIVGTNSSRKVFYGEGFINNLLAAYADALVNQDIQPCWPVQCPWCGQIINSDAELHHCCEG